MSATYDLGLFIVDQVLAGFGTSGEAVTGPEKAAQRFTSILLTERGSVTYNPDYGTTFVTSLRSGNIRTELDVTMYFNQAASDAIYYLTSLLTGTEPDDEVIQSVTLDHFELNPPDLQLSVIMLTRDGVSREIILPVKSLEVS